MNVVSVNVGTPEIITWGGREIRTAFRKRPIRGAVEFRGVNLVGDDQADRAVHGGDRKAVYVYPSEHYATWAQELGVPDLAPGSFGENLTTAGWVETEARIGDHVRIGSAEFIVVSARKPCYKMEAVFRRDDMISRFHRAGRPGFYLAGRRPGRIAAGDPILLLARDDAAPTVAQSYPAYAARAGLPPVEM